MNKLLTPLLVVLLTLTQSSWAQDITCEPKEVADYRDDADIIFIGKVYMDNTDADGEGHLMLEALRKWKGPNQSRVKVLSNLSRPVKLLDSEYYLLYLKQTDDREAYYFSPCDSRVIDVEFSGEDLSVLGKPSWSSGSD